MATQTVGEEEQILRFLDGLFCRKPIRAVLRQAFRVVWLVLSACGALALAAPFLLPAEAITGWAAVCQAPHESCAFCGMTRSFLLISAGEFAAAASLNRGAIPLFVVMAVNALAACAYLCVWGVRQIVATNRELKQGQ